MSERIDDIIPMTASIERLDRIEAILEALAEGQATFSAGQQQMQAHLERTQSQIDSTQAILEKTQAQVDVTLLITNSNARAVEAWATRIEEVAIDTEEATSATRADLAVRIEDNSHNQGIDRVRFDVLHEEHNQRFETLLEEARADRLAWRQSLDEQLAEMRRDRESNDTEHRAFTQNIQILLAEISRIWQRLAS
jgi:hypothetical protein